MSHSPNTSTRPVCLISGYRGLAETLISRFNDEKIQLSVLVRNEKAIPALAKKFPEVYLHVGDVSSEESCRAWVESSLQRFSRIDGLINNAAVTGPGGKLHELKFGEFEEAVRINFLMPVYLCQLVIPQFIRQGSGMVLNLSGGGATNPRPHFAAYGVAKTALVRMTENLAAEYPQFRFYAMAPGSLRTPMIEKVVEFNKDRIGKEYDEAKRRLEKGGDDPTKAAALALWLFKNRPEPLNGRLISAIWDKYEAVSEKDLKEMPLWTLRRVDEVLMKSVKNSNA
jgi:NAD(P)-dependent dehydrogenase (short-subunit alcohol dehydrogenase family)